MRRSEIYIKKKHKIIDSLKEFKKMKKILKDVNFGESITLNQHRQSDDLEIFFISIFIFF